jgi:hypothetical protein
MPERGESFYNIKDISEIQSLPEEERERIIREYLQTLEIIAQRVGGDFGMKVKVGLPGGGSFFDPENVTITFDLTHLIEDIDQAKFIAGHEGAHRAITPNPKEIGLSTEKTHELYSQLGFPYMQNVIEDGAINSWIVKRFPGLEEYTKKVYDKQFEKQNAAMFTPELQEFAARLGYVPKVAQWGGETLRDWHEQKFSENLDPDVKKALKRTIDYARKSIQTIPDPEKMDKKEIVQTGKKRFDTNTDYVWPEVKKLVEIDLKTEAQRQMLNDFDEKQKELDEKEKQMEQAEQSGDQQKQEQLQQEIDSLKKELNPFESLPDDVKQELEEKIDQALKEIEELEKKEGAEKPPSESLPQEQQSAEMVEESESEREVEGKPFPKDKLSDKAQKLIEKLFEKLTKKKKQELLEKAQKELEAFEDAMNKDMQAKLKVNPENHGQQEAREKEEQEREQQLKQEEEEKDRIEKELERQRKESMSNYERARSEVVGSIDDFYYHLRRIFKPEEYGGEESGFQSGQKLDITRAMQANKDIQQKYRLFIRETAPEKKSYRFWSLLDVSGSMAGEKQQETEKGFIIAGEALDRIEDLNSDTIDIRQGITAFHNRVFPYKGLSERFTKKTEDKLSTMAERVTDRDSGTNTFEATIFALENLKTNLGETGNYILTFSDGEPNYQVRDQLQELLREGKEDRENQKVKVGLIWLGESEDEQQLQELVKEYGYDFGLVMSAVKPSEEEKAKGKKDFSTALAELMEDLVENPDKY